MKKFGWKFIILIALAIIVFFWLIKAPVLSVYLTKKMRVPISVEWISIWPTNTEMRNFRVKNPKGFTTSEAFEVKNTSIDYQWRHLFSNPLVLDQILLDNIFLDVEFLNAEGSKNNWTEIAGAMPKPNSNQEILIRKLILTNFTIEIRGLGSAVKPFVRHVDRIEFDQIDSQQGFPTEELIHKVFGGAGLEDLIKDVFNPGSLLKDAVDPLSIF